MAENVADLTLAHVRKIDLTVSRIWEVLERHETRMGRVERDLLDLKRDIGELKSDQIPHGESAVEPHERGSPS